MNRKLHICFIQYNLLGGGAERKVCTLANFFASQGHQVEIGLIGVNEVVYQLDEAVRVTFLRRESYEYNNCLEKAAYEIKATAVKAAAGLAGLFSKKLGKRIQAHFQKKYDYLQPIRRFIGKRKNTVFITMMVSTYLEVLHVMGAAWKNHIKVPYLVMDCSDPKRNADPEMDHKRNASYPKADRVLVMTQEAKNYFSREIQEKCVVIPNPVRDDLPAPYEGERRKVIVNFCRLNRQKNLPLLIDAFAAFHKDHPEYALEQYGQGELEAQLKQQIADLGLTDCAKILPFDAQVHEKIRDCTMFVSSSDWEGFPNSVMEALALGIPTISTDCDFGPRDMIRDHVNGLLVPVGDADALFNAMCELTDDPAFAERLAWEGIKAREIFSVEKIGQQWLNLIETVIRERGPQ